MSKRTMQWQGGDERYGSFGGQSQQEDASDVPARAPAAQLAKRKIAQLKRRPRSESPLTSSGSIYEQANQNGLLGGNNNTQAQAPTNPFGTASSFTFGSANANGATTPSVGTGGFSFGSNSGQLAQNNQGGTIGFTFGSQSNTTTPSTSFAFGQSQPQTAQAPQTNGFTPSTTFNFGQEAAKPATIFGSGDATPKPASNPFQSIFNGTQGNDAKPQNIFGASQDTSKPTSNTFGGTTAVQPAQNGTTGFSFGSTASNTSEQPAGTGSKPQTNLFSGFGQQKSTEPQASTPATNGWAAFTQQKPAGTSELSGTPATPKALFTSATQPNGTSTNNASSIFSGLGQSSSKTPTFKFDSQPTNTAVDNDLSMMSPENTPQKPSTNMFASASVNGFGAAKSAVQDTPVATGPKPLFDIGKGPSLFDRISKEPEHAPHTDSQAINHTPAPTSTLFQGQTPLFAPAKSVASNSDDMSAPAVSSAQAKGVITSMNTTEREHFNEIRELNEALLQHLQGQDANKDWSSLFQYYMSEVARIQHKPATSTSANSKQNAGAASSSFGNGVLEKPPNALTKQAASSNGVNGSDESTSSEQPLYPKLPDTASKTAKLFQATLDKPSASTPPTTSLFAPKPAVPQSSTPSAGGFKPAGIASTGSSFLSSFGQKANETAEKEKEKRRNEDFDSDEDNEEEWEKKDREEQEARKAKLHEAAKAGSGFVFKPTAPSAGANPFPGFGQPAKTQSAEPVVQQPNKDTAPFKFGPFGDRSAALPAATPKATGLFGAPSTPAATSNGTSNLFSDYTKPSTPAPLFSFGQPSNTPAPATGLAQPSQNDAQQEGEDGEAAPPEPQLDDMAVLLPSEASENEVLFHVEKSKSRKFELRPSEGGTEKLTWIDKGLGPLWILRNKTSGKSRVLQKIKDSGRAAMNFSILAGANLYKHEGMNGKAVTATFVDHINANNGRPSRWIIMVGKPDDAKEIARILQEEQKKA